jgi:hypothetical protein
LVQIRLAESNSWAKDGQKLAGRPRTNDRYFVSGHCISLFT